MSADTQSGGVGPEAPPAGEQLHLPSSSLVPLINAFGAALALIGLALGLALTAIGLVIFVWSAVRWVGDTRREIEQLPRDG